MIMPAISSTICGRRQLSRAFLKSGFLLFASLLFGCTPLPPEHKVNVAAESGVTKALSAGTDQSGEACRYEPIPGEVADGMTSGLNVFCGTWEQPSGRVFEGKAAGTSDLAGLARSSAW